MKKKDAVIILRISTEKKKKIKRNADKAQKSMTQFLEDLGASSNGGSRKDDVKQCTRLLVEWMTETQELINQQEKRYGYDDVYSELQKGYDILCKKIKQQMISQ